MGQEHSTATNGESPKRGAHKLPPNRYRNPLSPIDDPDPRPASHTSKSSKSSSSSRYTTAVSRTSSTSSSISSAAAAAYHNHQPIYTNVHYRDVNNNDIYKPLKINKHNLHRLKILNADKDTAIYLEKHLSIKSYLEAEEAKEKEAAVLPESTQKKHGIRNYTPKILSEKYAQKDLEHWI